MTLYLWHLTAVISVTVAEHHLGLDRPAVGTTWFWPATLAHVTVCLAAVLLVVSATAPLEHLPVPGLESAPKRALPSRFAVAGVVLVAGGLLAFAATGMGGFPFSKVTRYAGIPLTPGLACALTAAGVLTVRAAAARTRS